jgi:hypothetical protein
LGGERAEIRLVKALLRVWPRQDRLDEQIPAVQRATHLG